MTVLLSFFGQYSIGLCSLAVAELFLSRMLTDGLFASSWFLHS